MSRFRNHTFPHPVIRCPWPKSELDITYHDREWGVPVHNEQLLFEMLTLEGAQAGLSWSTILKKREGYRAAFCSFDPEAIARFNDDDIERLMQEKGIVRNRLKIQSTIQNARAYLQLKAAGQTLDAFLWQFVDFRPIQNSWSAVDQVPARTPQSDAMSRALLKNGFKFVGSTICYALMQATGMVNDHLTACYRWSEV